MPGAVESTAAQVKRWVEIGKIDEVEATKLETNKLDGEGLLNMALTLNKKEIKRSLIDDYKLAAGAAEKLAPKIKALEGMCGFICFGSRSIDLGSHHSTVRLVSRVDGPSICTVDLTGLVGAVSDDTTGGVRCGVVRV